MVTVKVRETYDLHTVKNKMTVIAIHTPHPDIIKRNFPGLLMQCKAYRPKSADVRIACASVLPLDPKGVGLSENDVAPEDVFNPILYKAMSNFGMSQLEARINALSHGNAETIDVAGDLADVEVDEVTNMADEFPIYYGLLSNMHGWKHAMPQAGLSMRSLRPLVWEILYNVGDNSGTGNGETDGVGYIAPKQDGDAGSVFSTGYIRGNSKPMPFINTTSYTYKSADTGTVAEAGFKDPSNMPLNGEVNVPWLNVIVGAIIIPPSRLHELFYRMVVEWEIEFTGIRPISEITNMVGLSRVGSSSHYQNYNYEATKKVVTGDEDTILDNDSCMVSANVEVSKVM